MSHSKVMAAIQIAAFTDAWIKMWYIYTIDYYSAINKSEIMPSATTWI